MVGDIQVVAVMFCMTRMVTVSARNKDALTIIHRIEPQLIAGARDIAGEETVAGGVAGFEGVGRTANGPGPEGAEAGLFIRT